MRPKLLAAAIAAAATAAPAFASNVISFGFGTSPGRLLEQVDIPIRITGTTTVTFHGDPAAGCARMGVCEYAGTITLLPGSKGDLFVTKWRSHHTIHYEAFLSLDAQSARVIARVDRSTLGRIAGTCTDTVQSEGLGGGAYSSGRIAFQLFKAGGVLLSTRCAGPLDGDIAAAAPHTSLPSGVALRGEQQIDLSGTHSFSANGFAGTITSTVQMQLGKPRRQGGSLSLPAHTRTTRVRVVTETLKLQRFSGAVTRDVSGSPNPTVCSLLDTCGIGMTISIIPSRPRGNLELRAVGPAKRPLRDFLRALGRSRSGTSRGIRVVGGFDLTHGGQLTETVERPSACENTVGLGETSLDVAGAGGRLNLAYVPFSEMRTRCPGPLTVALAPIAAADVSAQALSARVIHLTLHGTGGFSDDGYTGTTGGHITLTLRRGRITQFTILEPAS